MEAETKSKAAWKVSESPVVMTDSSRFENLKTWRKNVKSGAYIIAQCLVHERSLGNSERYKKECEANAKLIAAAPELLEALMACEITLKAFLPDAFATISLVESALKKAKG